LRPSPGSGDVGLPAGTVAAATIPTQAARRIVRPATLVAATAALLSPGLVLGPSLDASVFVLAGVRIREGYMPYRDLWDHKPPGAYLLNAFGQVALPWLDPWLVSWILTFAVTAAAILIFDNLLRRRLSSILAWLSSLVCLVGIAWYPAAVGGGMTESFALLPLVAALWMTACRPRTWPAAAGAGVLLSIACVMSLQALPPAVVLAVTATTGEKGARTARKVARRAVALVAGGAVLPLAILGWLIAGGALDSALDQLVTYNAAYRGTGTDSSKDLLVAAMTLGWLILPAGVTVVRMVRAPRAFDRVHWAVLAWVSVSAVYAGYQGRLNFHYLILLAPPLTLLAAQGAQWQWAAIRSQDRAFRIRAIALSGTIACLMVISAAIGGQLAGIMTGHAAETKAESDATSAWLRTNTPASATVFVWGDDTRIYLSSGRNPYDQFVYQYPLVTPGYWSADRTSALLAKWEAAPPAVIVDGPGAVPMLRANPTDFDTSDLRNLDTFGPLRDYVRQHYRFAATFPDHDVYVYGPASTTAGRPVPAGGCGPE
jgi:hypothetical protein